ncbi:MAG: hypothetical protein ACREJ2_02375, partial [Planctomycetota bacterium]
MSVLSQELQYLKSHRQVDDTRRLRALWSSTAARERGLDRLPWLVRGVAALTLLAWLGGVGVAWSWHAGLLGAALFAAGWAAAEWIWRVDRRAAGLSWELDRLNPHCEGAFSLLEWFESATGPQRGRRQAVLEVALARVDWSRPIARPDRRRE